jgi:hypothetical protein
MKHLKTYRLFETLTALTKEQKGFLNEFTTGSWSLNPQTGKVDVNGTFNCSEEGLMNLKGIEFGNVSVDFHCNGNRLTSLEGAPQTVGGYFDCNYNVLTDLKGAPQKVGESFYCSNNRLTDLKGAPETVERSFDCSDNDLTSLKGAPQTVGGDFFCEENNLTSLKGAPQIVEGSFYCDEFSTKNWTPEGKLEILKTGTEAAKTLISTIISPEALQQQIDENPASMAVELKEIWKTLKKTPGYEKLKFPPEYSEEAEMLSDLGEIGL